MGVVAMPPGRGYTVRVVSDYPAGHGTVKCPACARTLLMGAPAGHFTVLCKRCGQQIEVRTAEGRA